MNKFEEQLKTLLEERETIIAEMSEIKKAFDVRQQRLVEIAGSIKTVQELMSDENDEIKEENINATEN